MARPRREIVDPPTTCYCHVTTRCVRRAFLLKREDDQRKRMLPDQQCSVPWIPCRRSSEFAIILGHVEPVASTDRFNSLSCARNHPIEWMDPRPIVQHAEYKGNQS